MRVSTFLFLMYSEKIRRMKHFIIIALTILMASCGNSKQKQTPDTKIVTVSVLPQKYLVERIVGDFLTVNVMVPPGASPSDYEPTPKQMVSLNNSSNYFYVGYLGFEEAWLDRLAQNAPNTQFISCSQNLELVEGSCEHHHEHEGHHHDVDPHVWMSPLMVKQIVTDITKVVASTYPEKAAEFNTNAQSFIAEVDSLHAVLETTFADQANRSFMIFHPALGYFAHDYHLEQYSIEYEGKSPSTAHLRKMIDLVNSEKISTIFIQSQFETDKAKSVAEETKIKIVSINPLAENWLEMMNDIKEKMSEALTSNK